MDRSEEKRRQRAAARASLPIRRITLTDESEPDLCYLDASARIAMLWPMTLDAWASSGRPLPTYERSQIPGRLIRGTAGDPT